MMAKVACVHLVDGRALQDRPCHASMLQFGVGMVGGELICLKTAVEGASLVLSQHGHPAVDDAARVLGMVMDRIGARYCVAWDVASMAVLVASGRRGVAVLDEEIGTDLLPPDGVIKAGAFEQQGSVSTRPPWVSVPDASLSSHAMVAILAEPSRDCRVSWCEHVIGRWHLLGTVPPVVLAGRTSDQHRLTEVLRRFGVPSVRVASLRDVWPHVSSASVVLAGVGDGGGMAPAVRAWASGARVVLPAGHAATALLAGHDGVFVQADHDPDVTVRALLHASSADMEARRGIVHAWNDQWAEALLTACQAIVQSDRQPVDTAG